jgi:bifunctional non-homologous end joining protein LigD
MSLKEYRRKRDFTRTAEPGGGGKGGSAKARQFVIQKHAASSLHFDFRLQLGRTLVSWAVPKGMPMKKGEKRLAIKVEDHPLSYIDFEGTIPKGEYGGGTVQVWETGTYVPLSRAPKKELESGKLHVVLSGTKLQGEWYLVRLREENQWLIIRGGDDHPKLNQDQLSRSALSGKTLPELSKKNSAKNGKPTSARAKKSAATNSKAFSLDDLDFVEPMKALSVETPPAGDWVYEVKFDGFRIGAYKQGREVRLISRTKHDLTDRFAEVAEAFETLKVQEVVIDGELVALDDDGRSSFQRLQAFELGRERPPLRYYAFDLISFNGKPTTGWPLEKRKKKLQTLLPSRSPLLSFSSSLGSNAELLLKKAAELGFEGIIGKRVESLYESGQRSGAWIKLKLLSEQEFVIGGYTEPSGSRQHLGALLVGTYSKGKLMYAGKVGTGFNSTSLLELYRRLSKIARKTCPFANLPEETQGRYGQGITSSVMKKCHWVQPKLVCQIKFTEWTRDGKLRHPVYLGLRSDKSAKEVIREPHSRQ